MNLGQEKTIGSLYIHFPYCRNLCNYCDFYKTLGPSKEQLESFQQYLILAWEEHEKLLAHNGYKFSKLQTLYLGGGTPSLWGVQGAEFLGEFLKDRGIEIDKQAEITLEVNPGSWTYSSLRAWKSFGVNRYSLGVQSLNSRFLKVLDRIHSINDVYETLEAFSDLEENFSVDFMLGLPFSKEYQRSIETELSKILTYNPSHLSLYILTTPKGYRHRGQIPNEEWIESEYLYVAKELQAHDYAHYEVSNFAQDKKESLHNLNYWNTQAVAALGPSATGFLPTSRFRYRWKPTLSQQKPTYEVEELTQEQLRLEKFYMGLRSSDLGVLGREFFSGDELKEFEKIAQAWSERGLALIEKKTSGNHVYLKSKGYLLLDSLIDEVFSRVKSL